MNQTDIFFVLAALFGSVFVETMWEMHRNQNKRQEWLRKNSPARCGCAEPCKACGTQEAIQPPDFSVKYLELRLLCCLLAIVFLNLALARLPHSN